MMKEEEGVMELLRSWRRRRRKGRKEAAKVVPERSVRVQNGVS